MWEMWPFTPVKKRPEESGNPEDHSKMGILSYLNTMSPLKLFPSWNSPRRDNITYRYPIIDIEDPDNQIPEDEEQGYGNIYLRFPFNADGVELEKAAEHSPELKYRNITNADLVLNQKAPHNLLNPNLVGTQGSVEGKHSISIKLTDFESLNGIEWLTDNIVDFLMEWIGRTLHEKSDVYIYRTAFYSFLKLDKGSLKNVSKWTTCNPFDKHILLLPICYGDHWTLAVVLNAGAVSNPPNINERITCVLIFDSLGKNYRKRNDEIYTIILEWLNNMWNKKERSKREKSPPKSNEKEESSIGPKKVFTEVTCKMYTPNGTWLSNCCFNIQSFMICSSRSITKIPLFIHSSSTG